ncbi:hypothetical protein Zmor_015332 [Zophobas morio]|uniref:Uncharacterized protein n=1 Tax=Zophobas morio TaxID=2755281 RepID=A0AA38MH40_9CUCU|nr:hypothetical protein Zmor_015332 [Zophobas morio]
MDSLLVTVVVLKIFCVANGKPVSQDNLPYISEVTATHFGKSQDFKDVKIPPEQNSINNQPHSFNSTNDGSGNYYFQFRTFNLQRYEIGELKNAGTDNEIQVVRGQYVDRYKGNRGDVVRKIGYVADENGYRPFVVSVDFVPSLVAASSPPRPGAPAGPKTDISSAALGSLIGGNSG